MRQRPRQSRWIRWLVALLAADVALGLVFGTLLLRRSDARGTPREDTAVSGGPGQVVEAPAPSAPPPTTAPSPTASAPIAAPARTATAPAAVATPPPAAPPPAAVTADPSPPPAVDNPRAGALPPNPLISRGKPAFASPDVATPDAVTDGRYCGQAAWRTGTTPSWLAIQVGAGPSRLLLSWNGGDPDNYVGADDAPGPGVPVAYTIQTSADSTDGADGAWRTVATVRDNAARTRAHSVPFAGASWVRMAVTGVADDGPLAIDEIDVHDISRGSADTVFFMGDSITASAFLRCDRLQPSYAALVHRDHPDYFPALIDGGVAGVSSDWGVERIDRWLADNPDYHVWAIAYGTNDAYRERPSAVFEGQLQTLIDKAAAAGKEPVLARIPYTDNAAKDAHVQRLNGIIDELTARNGLRPGPDLYGWFKAHPEELAADGIHATAAGSVSINRLWYEALRSRYEPAAGAGAGAPAGGRAADQGQAPLYARPAGAARPRRGAGWARARGG